MKGRIFMELTNTKAYPFTIDTAWKALHKTSSLNVEPGSKVEIISDTEWKAHALDTAGKEISCTHYTATFDEEKKIVTVESVSNKKHVHDFIYLELSKIDENHVELKVDMEINLGIHLIARAIAPFIKKHAENIIMQEIFNNFEAVCTGNEVKPIRQEELDSLAKEAMTKHFSK